jgi:hypothetical protein
MSTRRAPRARSRSYYWLRSCALLVRSRFRRFLTVFESVTAMKHMPDGRVFVHPDDDLTLGENLPAERLSPELGQRRQVVSVNDDVMESDNMPSVCRSPPTAGTVICLEWPPNSPASRIPRANTPDRTVLLSHVVRRPQPGPAARPDIELYIRWMQEVRRFKPSTVSRRLWVAAGFHRTCGIDGILERLRLRARGHARAAGPADL